MKKFTNTQWQAMSETEKINEIKESSSKFEPIILPIDCPDKGDNMKLERKAGAMCVIQYM